MKPIYMLTLMAPLLAQAAEQEVACDLERAKAAVAATVAEAPYMYGSISNQPNDKAATVGAGWSLGGRLKGKHLREAADAKCTALAATLQLDEQQRWAIVNIEKSGARAELESLLAARSMAQNQLTLLTAQLNGKTVTLTEYNAARTALVALELRVTELKVLLAQATQPTNMVGIRGLLETAKANLGRASELDAQAQADAAWDVSAVVGGRKDLSNLSLGASDGRSAVPFVGLTFRWSFGASESTAAVKAVRAKTEELFAVGQSGYVKAVDRLVSQVADVLKAEQERAALLSKQVDETRAIIASFKGLDTALALNAKRSLELQAAMQQAQLDGVRRRVTEYTLFMQRLT